MRRAKIVCTIGPATNSEQQLEQLIRAGMNVVSTSRTVHGKCTSGDMFYGKPRTS